MNYPSPLFLLPLLLSTAIGEGQAKGPHIVTNQEQYKHLIDSPGNAIVLFSTPTCRNCTYVKDPFNELALEPDFADINIIVIPDATTDEMNPISDAIGIQGVPTFIFIKDGQEQYRSVGGINNPVAFKTMIRDHVKKYLSSEHEASVTTPEQPTEEAPIDHSIVSQLLMIIKKGLAAIGAIINKIINTITQLF